MPMALDGATLRRYLLHLGFQPRLAAGETTYLILAGAQLDGGDPHGSGHALSIDLIKQRPDHYDDLAVTYVEPADGELALLHGNRATVDPGTYHNHSEGRANLVYGHPHLFVKGKHNGNGKSVFRPKDGTNRYWRDRDVDEKQDPEEVIRTGNGTLLIHAMSGDLIKRWGAGCVGIWDSRGYAGKAWGSWRRQAAKTCDSLGSIQVVIMPASDLWHFLRNPQIHKPTLWPGATGKWVRHLQELLNGSLRHRHQEARLKVDGDFGPATLEALQGAQEAAVIEADGIVGPDTWAALEAIQ